MKVHLKWLFALFSWLGKKLNWMKYLNPFRHLKILDWYIIKKFIGTYFYSIALIISISIVFDINENLQSSHNTTLRLKLLCLIII